MTGVVCRCVIFWMVEGCSIYTDSVGTWLYLLTLCVWVQLCCLLTWNFIVGWFNINLVSCWTWMKLFLEQLNLILRWVVYDGILSWMVDINFQTVVLNETLLLISFHRLMTSISSRVLIFQDITLKLSSNVNDSKSF